MYWPLPRQEPGKTAAFAIPVLHMLQRHHPRKSKGEVRCLVMVPTRELAIQIGEVFVNIAKYTKLNILSLHGGVDQAPQLKKAGPGPGCADCHPRPYV